MRKSSLSVPGEGPVKLTSISLAVLLLLSFAYPARPAAPPRTAPGKPYDQTAEAGPHHRRHRVPQTVVREINGVQVVTVKTNRYVEIATGLNYQTEKDGPWLPTQEVIEIEGNRGVARNGPHRVFFAGNLNTAGAIELIAPDGKRFRSHPLALSYYDAAAGRGIIIAVLKDCQGEILPPNQVIYRDAFLNVLADVRFTYRKSGFEQDIILRENLPPPEQYGMDPATTRLQVMTEFVEAPAPAKRERILRKEPDPVRRLAMADLIDHELYFGAMRMAAGKGLQFGRSAAWRATARGWHARVQRCEGMDPN
jgi:hypothetical protein